MPRCAPQPKTEEQITLPPQPIPFRHSKLVRFSRQAQCISAPLPSLSHRLRWRHSRAQTCLAKSEAPNSRARQRRPQRAPPVCVYFGHQKRGDNRERKRTNSVTSQALALPGRLTHLSGANVTKRAACFQLNSLSVLIFSPSSAERLPLDRLVAPMQSCSCAQMNCGSAANSGPQFSSAN